MKKGFTLIELLVVVLIIGILSAIALPQYEKAVEKTRLTEVVQNISHLQKAIDIYLLENGGYPSSRITFFSSTGKDILNIDVTSGMECSVGGCRTKYFWYSAYCDASYCDILADRGLQDNKNYSFRVEKAKGSDEWIKECSYDPKAEYLCASLESQGYARTAC